MHVAVVGGVDKHVASSLRALQGAACAAAVLHPLPHDQVLRMNAACQQQRGAEGSKALDLNRISVLSFIFGATRLLSVFFITIVPSLLLTFRPLVLALVYR